MSVLRLRVQVLDCDVCVFGPTLIQNEMKAFETSNKK